MPLIAAVGDVHGRFDLLDPLLNSLEQLGQKNGGIRVVLLGDYVDRGPQSKEVIDRLLAGPTIAGNEFITIGGNHDECMLAAIEAGRGTAVAGWYEIGGIQTIMSYGLEDEDDLFNGRFLSLIPKEHVAFLKSLLPYYTTDEQIFVHAGLRPWVPLEEQSLISLKWIRDEFLDVPHDFGRLVVHGHTWLARPDIREFRIGIDTGAYETNILTAAVFRPGEPLPDFMQATGIGPGVTIRTVEYPHFMRSPAVEKGP